MLLSTEVRKQRHARSYRDRVEKPTVPRKEDVLSIIGWGMKEKDSKERQRYALGNSEKLAHCIVTKRSYLSVSSALGRGSWEGKYITALRR